MKPVPWELNKSAWKEQGIIDACITGSSLVMGIEHNDVDYIVLFDNDEDVQRFCDRCGGTTTGYEDANLFYTCRRGEYNFICTIVTVWYYRMVAFSGALELLQLKNRDERVALARACRDWETRL